MSIGKTDVINAALLLTGAQKLFTPRDDTKGARLAASIYDIALGEVYDLPVIWKFATSRAELSQMSETPAFGYGYQYELPAKCRNIVATVDEGGDKIEYEHRREVVVIRTGRKDVEHDVILTNEDEVFVKYIRLREDPNKWPGYFTKLVYLNIALLLCEPLKQDKQKENQLMIMWRESYKLARESNGMENADVSDDNVRVDLGNQDVVDAAIRETVTKKYIVNRSS